MKSKPVCAAAEARASRRGRPVSPSRNPRWFAGLPRNRRCSDRRRVGTAPPVIASHAPRRCVAPAPLWMVAVRAASDLVVAGPPNMLSRRRDGARVEGERWARQRAPLSPRGAGRDIGRRRALLIGRCGTARREAALNESARSRQGAGADRMRTCGAGRRPADQTASVAGAPVDPRVAKRPASKKRFVRRRLRVAAPKRQRSGSGRRGRPRSVEGEVLAAASDWPLTLNCWPGRFFFRGRQPVSGIGPCLPPCATEPLCSEIPSCLPATRLCEPVYCLQADCSVPRRRHPWRRSGATVEDRSCRRPPRHPSLPPLRAGRSRSPSRGERHCRCPRRRRRNSEIGGREIAPRIERTTPRPRHRNLAASRSIWWRCHRRSDQSAPAGRTDWRCRPRDQLVEDSPRGPACRGRVEIGDEEDSAPIAVGAQRLGRTSDRCPRPARSARFGHCPNLDAIGAVAASKSRCRPSRR